MHFDGRAGGVGIFDGTFLIFFYDRQDWRRYLLLQYILGRYLGIYVSMYLGGTVLCEVFAFAFAFGYSIHGCCHTLIHYFFFESRKGGIIKVDGRLVGYTFARAYACVCVRMYVAVCVPMDNE